MVFVDYQNLFKGAREAFGYKQEGYAGHYGNFRPYSLGRLLVRDGGRSLLEVRVYTGVPTPKSDPKGNKFMQRRIAAWVGDMPDKVGLFPRPLRYPPPQGREKGVDVELAIDLVRLGLDDAFDVAVVASADTDLVPALEFVAQRCEGKQVETATWAPEPGYEADTAAPVDIPGGGISRRAIPKSEFDRIAERRNFMLDKTEPAARVGEKRWGKIKGRLGG
jgi:hypothetical protein